MTKFTKTLLFLTLVLGACSPNIAAPDAVTPPSPSLTSSPQTNIDTITEIPFDLPTIKAPGSTKIIVTVSTPNIGQPPDGDFSTPTSTPTASQMDCGYQWAYSELPELTDEFDQAIKSLNPDSFSHVTAFGENCAAPDGQVVKFLAMETDFYVTVIVTDLKDYESFGNFLAQVMQVVNSFPPDMLAGPNSGFVEFQFKKSDADFIQVHIPIYQYNDTAKDKTGEELFRLFYTEP